jgi:hypothetical protein
MSTTTHVRRNTLYSLHMTSLRGLVSNLTQHVHNQPTSPPAHPTQKQHTRWHDLLPQTQSLPRSPIIPLSVTTLSPFHPSSVASVLALCS